MEWFYSGIGGIRQEENSIAFKQIVIHPEIVQGLTHAETSYDSPYGRISTNWKVESKGLQLEVEIPANTTAELSIPIAKGQQITEGGRAVRWLAAKGRALIRTGSGKYQFIVQ